MVSFLATTGRPVAPDAARAEERRQQLADFEALYFQHAEFVRRVIARIVGPVPADVDDAVQEVFLTALRRRDSFEGKAEPSTWLCAIARRVALSARRRARVRVFLGLETVGDLSDAKTPLSLFENHEATRLLYSLLDRVSEKKRTVFILHELEELPGETIAKVVGCPLKTVWTRLFHARRELAALVGAAAERSRP